MQGLRSHLSQARKCHERWRADLDAMRIQVEPEDLFDAFNDDNNHAAGIPADEPNLEDHGEGHGRDEDDSDVTLPIAPKARWREYFSHQAGRGLHREPSVFEKIRSSQVAKGESIWGRFSDEGDWEVAQWIVESGTTLASANKLALQIRENHCTSFHNSRSLLQKVDALPRGPEWTCELLGVEGDILDEGGAPRTERVELIIYI